MKKNHLLYYFIVLCFVINYSCSNDNDNTPAPPSYNSINDLEKAIDSLHISMSRLTQRNAYFISGWAGDDMTTTSTLLGKLDFWYMDNRGNNASSPRINHIWSGSYQTIAYINSILEKIPNSNQINENQKNYLSGEAYFIRGILYHHLTRVFKDVPLQLDTEIDVALPPSSISQVYAQIESDLLKASDLLPKIYPNTEVGAPRPNKGSAKAFLSRLYLDWAGYPVKDNTKYALSASIAKQVIDNHDAHGFNLLNNLDDLWTMEHKFNKESIYTVVQPTGNLKFGRAGIPIGNFGGWGETLAEIKFFESFPENHRKQATYTTNLEIQTNNTGPFVTINWVNFPNDNSPLFAKIIGKDDIPYNTIRTDRNDYMMRYAEVLLIFAEASARSGNSSPMAWEALNKVKRRAELLPPNEPNISVDVNSGDLAELAYTEKGWELAGEFLRWFDLVRMERVSLFLNEDYRNDISSEVTDPNHPDYGEPLTEENTIKGSLGTDNYFVPLLDYETRY